MKNTRQFDVLVVYNQNIAASASSNIKGNIMPFSLLSGKNQYNEAYSFFLEICKKNNLSAAFTTTADISKNGICKSYWEYSDSAWTKTIGKCYSKLVFDKFSPLKPFSLDAKSIFLSSTGVHPFNDPVLHRLFDDKFHTYETLTNFTIPTVQLPDNSLKSIKIALKELKKLTSHHLNTNDFSASIIVKDRFGAGGTNIFKVDTNHAKKIHSITNSHNTKTFVLQPFMKFDKGYSYGNNTTATDVRIIYLRGKVIQAYIRMAKKDDFRCNEHQGGIVQYITEQEIPLSILLSGQQIIKKLNRKNALYTLDFIVSNAGNVYFLEGNINPGIYWGKDQIEDEKMTKRLIRIIVKECLRKIAARRLTSTISIPVVIPEITPLYPFV